MTLELTPHQSRGRPPTSYEDALADELEAIYGRGIHELPGVVVALNETGVRPAGGQDWTEDSFAAELARLARRW
ncbi:hypothetical protein EV191_11576 [Tamaricihabitans halophyticus]|uniref:Recombinase-like domain-containing protein n=1 Tax=Tamaricihabitans halophyticus TaxID=1262583 RepID=A0A4V2SSD1_9PSEU|nr:recombinase-like helix-turn-helix domain-containing protein [Tamaricihabitans halophyticus]TCP45796.1 hypothetical protein EV191_11576 [Tamaricihabitans halophyticus]